MNLSIGIVGLPNVGKSTMFNAITNNQVEAQNYPFCTIDPNVGIVAVPDNRLSEMEKVISTKQLVPAVVEFIDIAGIVKGASTGEGLGNKFLANIRSCDAIAEVVRVFEDSNVLHVSGVIDPISDIETIKTELILADIETVTRKLEKTQKEIKKEPKLKPLLDTLEKVEISLNSTIPIREMELNEKEHEHIADLSLLTAKPHIYVLNGDEKHLVNTKALIQKTNIKPQNAVFISAKIESELNELSKEEKREYLAELGQNEPGLDTLVKKGFDLLGLQTYFTAGEKEIKAWTIKKGWTAPQAAGVIHGDFEKGFIKAEVVNYSDLISNNGWVGAKTDGKVRLEGRDYIVQDGDVMIFKFNV
ncbi:MAG: redox-regulated ATPase YchF [bacterium]